LIDSKGRGVGCFGLAKAEMVAWKKKKAGASSRTPNVVYYNVNYSREYRKVKRNFGVL
jgi:hypothetical protein